MKDRIRHYKIVLMTGICLPVFTIAHRYATEDVVYDFSQTPLVVPPAPVI